MAKFVDCFMTFVGLWIFLSCGDNHEDTRVMSEDFFGVVDKVTEVMVHDIFSPPLASRVYVYPNIAAYEILAQNSKKYNSFVGQLPELTAIPKLPDGVNSALAALIAHAEVSKSLLFSEGMLQSYTDSIYANFQNKNATTFKKSKQYALEVVNHIKAWMDKDAYAQTRTMPKYHVNLNDLSKWQPTPPAYMDAIEPHWDEIRPMTLDSASQFKPERHPDFSLEEGSDFYKEIKEVYDVSINITRGGDETDEIAIAQFWDCNPYVSVTRGHLMFATKKISPGAHWMGICKIACRQVDADFEMSVYANTLTSIAIFDAFISCWDEKYRSNLVRPETLINKYIDENWHPILQTPPFPEYTSGHSVVSGAASVMLTALFGDGFTFKDTTEIPYGLPVRGFESFAKAAEEAAVSRLYGGIHYRAAVDRGLSQGRSLGEWVVGKTKARTL